MSDLARRTKVRLKVNGTDISADINKYLLSFSYSDEQSSKTDDISIVIDDREGLWLKSWLNASVSSKGKDSSSSGISVGDSVMVRSGAKAYDGSALASWVYSYTGFTVIEVGTINRDRIVIGVGGAVTAAVRASDLISSGGGSGVTGSSSGSSTRNGLIGATIDAWIIQENWESDGKKRELKCGSFSVDTIKASGPPSKITIKATSLPVGNSSRAEKKSRAWENIRLSGIAAQVASEGGLTSSFSGGYDPKYSRKEQYNESDMTFLQRLCEAAGISLKVTDGALILYDEDEYEGKPVVAEFKPGDGTVISYDFSDGSSEKAYSSCHVSYTNPTTGVTIEYTYTPRIDNPGTGEVLEINEMVESREEARKLAMKRLKAKNKDRFSASLKVVGNARLAAGAVVGISGWGDFDGRYMVKTAGHDISGQYTTKLTLRKCLEGYT